MLRSDEFCGQVTGQVTMSIIEVMVPENRAVAPRSGEARLPPA
jgi:hypothetical protein